MSTSSKAKLNVITAMFIYGTIGLFVRYIPLPSSVISMVRGLIGAPFLFMVLKLKKQSLNTQAIRANLKPLIFSSVLLGINWIFLFEAYRYTTVATATLCYYFAPILIIALSPFVFKEKLTVRKLLCILAAVVGMFFVSGAYSSVPGIGELKGIALALSAALMYALIVIFNKKINDLPAFDRTIFQIALSVVVVLLPYNIISGSFSGFSLSAGSFILLLALGIIHTGIAYLLYFGSMDALPSQTLAVLSYIDPLVAVLISALILKEAVGLPEYLGAALILGAALFSEMPERTKTEPVKK